METENIIIDETAENAGENGFSAKQWRKAANISALLLILFIIVQYSSALIPRSILKIFMDKDSAAFKNLTKAILYGSQYLIGVPLAIFICRRFKSSRTCEKTFSLVRKPQKSLWWVIRWCIISIGLSYMTSIGTTLIMNLFQSLTKIQLNQTDFSADDTLFSKLTNVIAIIILAPVFEEMLMRDAFLGHLKRYSSWAAVIITGLFFGLLHCNYPQVPFATVLGACSAFMVIQTKSIIPSVCIHMCINTIGGITSLFINTSDLSNLGDINFYIEHIGFTIFFVCAIAVVMCILAAAITLFILEIVFHKESFKLPAVHPEVSEKKKFALFFTAPLPILLTLFTLVMTVLNAIPQ